MNVETQRECPFCAETIQAAARVCPRCRQWLSLRSFRHPLVATCVTAVPIIVLAVVMGLGITRTFERFFNPPPYYTEFLGSLRVIESRLNWVERDKETSIYITGILTNQSPIAWKGIEFECRFYDSKGVMVDASSAVAYLTIQPNDECAFRARVTPSHPAKDYASHKLLVSTARNAKAPF